MKHIVIGTAGHIDHGKTALVRALTGIETDRLEEEKRRGISIDIGFAHLELTPELRVAFIDVPGHEKFIKNMLAGTGGIDLLLLVVAADSSVQPQTREHFEIARLLGLRHGLVAITKTDLADPDMVELVRLEVEELAAGSFLAGAPVLPVSAVTGDGLDALKRSLTQLAETVQPRDAAGHFRLPVDRAFAQHGFGAVVTGTVWSGAVAPELEVELHPGERRLRVRGVQVHGRAAKKAVAGQRAALNLAGVDHRELERGMTLTAPGLFHDTRAVDVALDLLPSAKPLKHRAPVHFHTGTTEVEAEVRRLEGTEPLAPGRRSYARIILRDAVLLLPGDRFIVRMFSPVVTIGGGIVLDAHPPRRANEARAQLLDRGSLRDRLNLFIAEAPYGVSTAELLGRTGLTEAQLDRKPFLPGWYLSPDRAKELAIAWRATLTRFHQENPLLPGMPKEQLRGETPAPLFEELLKRDAHLRVTGEVAHLATHKLALKQDEEQAVARIEAAFERAGLQVPAVGAVLTSSGVEPARARSLLQILLREKKLVRVTEDLVFHHTALTTLRGLIAARKGQRFGVGEFKDWTGISRKYAIPLLELLDRERLTRRDGDARVVV